jgi:arylformamidase
MYVNSFNTSERQIDMYVVPNVDHFDELNVLADPGSIFFNKICAILGLERTNR